MPTAPYPTLESVVNYVRDIVNDAITPGGQTLTDTQPFTIDYINLGWIELQQFLVAQGFVTETDETVIPAIQATSTQDPALQVSLSWGGYNNGGGLDATKVLPQNLIRPLKLWERPTFTGTPPAVPKQFNEMDFIEEGLDSVPKQMWNQQWEWRADAIYMPGALTTTDIRVRFAKYFPNFTSAAFAGQVVPIMRCEVAFAGFIAKNFSAGRGDVDADKIFANAKDQAMMLVSLDSLEGRSMPKDSQRGKMKDRYSGGEGQPS
jgi:hypothetical protein